MSLQSRYTILRKITDGGTAEIFLAKQHGAQGFEKMVVLKRVFTTFYADPQFRHMLVDEAHVAMSLNHSNIVQVLDLGEADGRYFLALELVDGWTLDRVLRRAKGAGVLFPPALALYVTAEICRALGYAHGKARGGRPLGIVHRDVSPHNVLLSEQGEVKITDFGIAKADVKRERSLGNLIKGKIAFMSPEQASGGALDARSDLFSVGTMLYVMVTRKHPFDAPTDYETLMLVKSGDFVPPETARPGMHPDLYRVIRRSMGKTADERYQKAEDMLVDVEQVMRLAFRPVGQTELQRWLADLTAKDGVPPLTRDAPAAATVVDPPVGPLRAGDGQESGLVLSLDDAEDVRPRDQPPPTPAATEVMKDPPRFVARDRPWHDRPAARIGGAAALLLAVIVGIALRHHRRVPAAPAADPAGAATATPPATSPTLPVVAAPPVANQLPSSAAAPPPVGPAAAVGAQPAAASPAPAPAVAAAPPSARPAAQEAPQPEAANDDATAARVAPGGFVVLALTSDPEGSRVSMHYKSYGTTPVTLRIRPGSNYRLTLSKPGYATTLRHYRPDDRKEQTLRVTLKKLSESKKPQKPAAAATPPPPKKGWFAR